MFYHSNIIQKVNVENHVDAAHEQIHNIYL